MLSKFVFILHLGTKIKKERKKTDGPKKKKTRTTFTAYQLEELGMV